MIIIKHIREEKNIPRCKYCSTGSYLASFALGYYLTRYVSNVSNLGSKLIVKHRKQ